MSTMVIGIGNRERADDALGLIAIDRLQREHPAGVEFATARGDVLKVLDLFEGAHKVIMIDAMRSGGTPGQVVRLDVSDVAVKVDLANFASSHTVNLAEAIELARTLGRLPAHLIVYGVEAQDFTLGNGLSPAVAAALEGLLTRVRKEWACTKHG